MFFKVFLVISCVILHVGAKKATIVTNDPDCTKIAANIFKSGGNYIDSVISAVLCETVVKPQDTGIGGGFTGVMKNGKSFYMINAREKTPYELKSQKDIKNKPYGNIGTPGLIKGLELLHQKFGKLSWFKIFKPIIDICKKGLPITDRSATLAWSMGYKYLFDENRYHNHALCTTLEQIQKRGAKHFYTITATKILKDLNDQSYLSKKDFRMYEAVIQDPANITVSDTSLFSTSYPGVGKQLLDSLESIINKRETLFTAMDKFYKSSYDYRYKQYNGTKKLLRRDLRSPHGTSNICVKSGNDGICITSTINQYFGSKFYSNSTGLFLNNQLDDLPVYYENITSPVTPPTSASITLVVKNGKLILLLGGTGGDRIPAGVISVFYYIGRYQLQLTQALRVPRVYYYNKVLTTETCTGIPDCENNYFIDTMKTAPENSSISVHDFYSYNTVTGIMHDVGSYDPRRGGASITITL